MTNRTIVNGRNGESFNVSDRLTHRVRAEMKSGVDTFDSQGLEIFIAIDRGLGEGFTTEIDGKCGNKVEMIVYTDFSLKSMTYNNDGEGNNNKRASTPFSKLLSQFKTLKNPFIGYVPTIGKIDSDDFEATDGILGRYSSNIDFKGSTFVKGPKMFSSEAMRTIRVFGDSNKNGDRIEEVWKPFAECDNMKSIDNQGTFEKIEYLFPIDLTFENDRGDTALSAYPSGGSPIGIFSYIYAKGKKVNFSENFPQFKQNRLKSCVNPFIVDAILLDKSSAPVLPFGGITFDNAEMDTLSLPEINFEMKSDQNEKMDSNFTFSWSSLGVNSPKSCKVLKGLHNIYQNISNVSLPTNIANVDFISKNLSPQWADNLKKLEDGKFLKHTDDWMPLVPEDIVSSHGHYKKIFIQEYYGRDYRAFTNYHMVNMMDGKELNYKVQKLPKHDVEDYYITDYCMNLYAYNEVNTDITVPAIPGPIDRTANCYKRTFYNTVGKKNPLSRFFPKPHLHMIWSDFSDSIVRDYQAHQFIFNVDENYHGEFEENFNRYCASSDINLEEIVKKITDADEKQKEAINKKLLSSTIKRYYNNGRNEEFEFENFRNFKDMVQTVKGFSPPLYYTRPITSKIVLEREDYSIKPENVCGWQKECFFGSTVDPTKTDCFIYISPSGVTDEEREFYSKELFDQENYKNCLNVRNVLQDHEYVIMLKGNIVFFDEEMWNNIKSGIIAWTGSNLNIFTQSIKQMNFSMILTFSYERPEDFTEDPFYELSNVKISGMAPRDESVSVLPYRDSFGVDMIEGDYKTLLENKDIKLSKWKNILGGMAEYSHNPNTWTKIRRDYIDDITRDTYYLQVKPVKDPDNVNLFETSGYEYTWMLRDELFEVDEITGTYMFEHSVFNDPKVYIFFKDGMNLISNNAERTVIDEISDSDVSETYDKLLEIEEERNSEWTR